MKFSRKTIVWVLVMGVLLASTGFYYLATKDKPAAPATAPSTSTPTQSEPAPETQPTPIPEGNLEDCLSKIPSSFGYDPEIENARKRCYELYP